MAAIKACAKARQWERALLIVTDDMAEYGVVPTVKSLNAVISACVKSGKLEQAMEVVNMMPDFNCIPNVRTATTLLHAVVRAQDPIVKSKGRRGVKKKSAYFADATSLVQPTSRRHGRADVKRADEPASAPAASRSGSSSGSVGVDAGGTGSDSGSGSGMEAPLISSYLELGEEELALALVNAYWRKPKPTPEASVDAAVDAAVGVAEVKSLAHAPSAAQTQVAGEVRLLLTSALVMLEEILGSDDNDVDADCLNVAITACFQVRFGSNASHRDRDCDRNRVDAASLRANPGRRSRHFHHLTTTHHRHLLPPLSDGRLAGCDLPVLRA